MEQPANNLISALADLPRLSLDDARARVTDMSAESSVRGTSGTFAVVDAGGFLVSLSRMDSASPMTVLLARARAFAAIATGGDDALLGLLSVRGGSAAFAALSPLSDLAGTRLAGGVHLSNDGVVTGAYAAAFSPSDRVGTRRLEAARVAIDRGRARATALGVTVSLVILDRTGTVIQSDRMDGAAAVGPEVARGKALTSLNFKTPSRDLADRLKARPELLRIESVSGYTMVPLPGGLPIFDGGVLLGAIGVSGATGDQDEEIAGASLEVD